MFWHIKQNNINRDSTVVYTETQCATKMTAVACLCALPKDMLLSFHTGWPVPDPQGRQFPIGDPPSSVSRQVHSQSAPESHSG